MLILRLDALLTFQHPCAFCVKCVQMKMTYDDQFLITISEDSCVMIWKVQDREGRNLKRDKEMLHAEEILITKSDLEEKVFAVLSLYVAFCLGGHIAHLSGHLSACFKPSMQKL